MLNLDLIRPLPELVAAHASEGSSRLAFRDLDRSVTYGDLYRRTGRLAGHLQDHGLHRGDRVVLYLGNSVNTIEGYLAITRAGGIGVCVNPGASQTEAATMIADSDPLVVITDPEHVTRLKNIIAGLHAHAWVICTGDPSSQVGENSDLASFTTLTANDATAPPDDTLPLDDPAWMVYTSGTTGRPKGVLLSQRNLLWMTAACWVPVTGFTPDTYQLTPLPMFHSYTLAVSVVGVLATGSREYILPRYTTEGVLEALHTEPITFMPGVPTMFNYLLQGAQDAGLGSSTLRLCMSAGAIMPAALNRDFERAFKIPLLDGYGITETSTMVTMNWQQGTRIMGSCGIPLPGSAVRIVNPDTGADVPVGTDGEFLVRGPHVMLGYYNRPEETARALTGGWYHTGDLGSSDQNGYLTVSGRTKEMIIRGGENIYPAEIENVLIALDTVADAAAAGRPDDVLGEVPVAFVVPRNPDTFDPGPLLEACQRQLSTYKVPVDIIAVEQIPRTGSGKVRRFELVEADPRRGRTPAPTAQASEETRRHSCPLP